MSTEHVIIETSPALCGTVELTGAKNAVLVIMASLILTNGKSKLTNVPFSTDVLHMMSLLTSLGARVTADEAAQTLEVDTSSVNSFRVSPEIMDKMRASILVLGPLLARFKAAEVALPGGCTLGARPIDYHIQAFQRMSVEFVTEGDYLCARAAQLTPIRFVLEYPSVGATENCIMAATLTRGTTKIINASLEPEVLDLIDVLTKMGAHIRIAPPATIEIEGVSSLSPVTHQIMYDRLEAGSLLLAAAITGGELSLPTAPFDLMDTFLEKLEEMGHSVIEESTELVSGLKQQEARAVSFRTMPYPGFPTDLQAPMMTAQCLASGKSTIQETVWENRLVHVQELQKMGAQISVDGQTATIVGVDELYGASVIAPDIRASYALVIAGLAAPGANNYVGDASS